jgi:hypothetical protein
VSAEADRLAELIALVRASRGWPSTCTAPGGSTLTSHSRPARFWRTAVWTLGSAA